VPPLLLVAFVFFIADALLRSTYYRILD
jgi:hypothetical protein